MKFSLAAIAVVIAWAPCVEGSFYKDVVGARKLNTRVEDALLAKAVPIEEYRAKLRGNGYDISRKSRQLDQNSDGDDDYYMNADYMYSFSGYSLKYAECQPVQKFSEDAIAAGEYTPMVTDDIVILRLCPSSSCSSSSTFGCRYNYAEYAVGISDYVSIMLRYTMDKEEQLCNWCNACSGAQRNLEENEGEGEDDNEEQQQDQQEDQQQEDDNQQDNQDQDQQQDQNAEGDDAVQDDAVQGDDANQAAAGDDANNWWSSGGTDDQYYDENDGCYDSESYCLDEYGVSICDAAQDDTYLGTEDYIAYMGCNNFNGYYIRPRCDGYEQTIDMGIYYDPFCSQYAGDKVNMNNLGLGFKSDIFESFYADVACIDCSSSNYPPYFDANANMCNRMHYTSASCASNLQYDLFDTDSSQQGTACSFIESIRFGTYDEEGQLMSKSSSQSARHITDGQKWMVSISLITCALLALYSCYLHHAITNLLIKSLSHTDLLPPSRNERRSRNSSSRRSRSSRRKVMATDGESDDNEWEKKEQKHGSSRSSRMR